MFGVYFTPHAHFHVKCSANGAFLLLLEDTIVEIVRKQQFEARRMISSRDGTGHYSIPVLVRTLDRLFLFLILCRLLTNIRAHFFSFDAEMHICR